MTATASVPNSKISDQEFGRVWKDPGGLIGRLRVVQNEPLGQRFILTAFMFFAFAGFDTLMMRTQLARPENTFLDALSYNRYFTMHGSAMMFLFAVPLIQGLATLTLPQLLGARELPFPRLTAFTYWTFLFGGLLFYTSGLFRTEPDVGWFAYLPLSGSKYSPGMGVDFWLLGLNVAEIGAIASAFELIIAIFKMRAPGMSLHRIPLFAWALLVTSFMMIFAFTPLIVGSTLLEFDRELGTHFYNPEAGGSVLLWQHIFWSFGHPDVYIQFLPAAGIVSMIIPVFTRRPMAGYTLITVAMIAMGFLSFGLWLHHMFTVGAPQLSQLLFAAASMLIGIPSGIQVFAWIATIWSGRPIWKTPFLFAVGFLVLFVVGGLTGIMVAVVPFDWQVHDTYFVVAHFHYTLIGGVLFPLFAAIYYWMPKYTGRFLNERLGRWHFWLLFVGFNVAFLPMHLTGLLGMPRRVYTYPAEAGWDDLNLVSTLGTYLTGVGVAVFFVNLVYSYLRGARADQNPWNAYSLEWATATPQPAYGFRVIPIVRSRYPLWEQTTLEKGDPKTENLLRALADWPLDWRSQIVTSTLDAKPEELFRIAGPSIAPFVLAVGVTVASAALIFDLYWLILVGALISVVAIVAWLRPDLGAVKEHTTEDEEFERAHGIPVNAEGSVAVTRGGMWLTVLALAVALATLGFSYFHIRAESAAWPPQGIPRPDLLLPGLSTLIALLSLGAMGWAAQSIRRNRQGALQFGLALGSVLGLVALGLYGGHFMPLNFTPQTNAYGSLYFMMGAFLMLTALTGLAINAFVFYFARRGDYHARRRVAVDNAVLFWALTLVIWLVNLATLHLTPWLF